MRLGISEEIGPAILPHSASASSLPRVALCFGFLLRFGFSSRRTAGGVPSTSRDTALTAVEARNLRIFLFFGKDQFKHTGCSVLQRKEANVSG